MSDFQARYYVHMNRSLHNRDVEIARLNRELGRARRALQSCRASLTQEREVRRERHERVIGAVKMTAVKGPMAPGFLALMLGTEP